MATDLFGMAVENRKSIRELITVSSPRIDYYPLLDGARNFIPPLIFNNVHLISLDKTFINGLIVCKHCHMLFTDTRWNRPVFLKHLSQFHGITKFHGIARNEPKPEPKSNPIQFTDTPVTINLMEPNTEVRVPPTEPKEEVTKAVAPSEDVRKTHHKKKIPIKVEPICLDTIYDHNYVPATPIPVVSDEWVVDWEAPLEKKSRSQKRKAHATSESNPTGSNTMAKKKAGKNPKLGGEKKPGKKPKLGGEKKKTSSKPHLEHPGAAIPILPRPPHANKAPKARAAPIKHAERKDA